MVTGANQGGKSTFLRSVGLAQLMMQCGMLVPADDILFESLRRPVYALQSGKRIFAMKMANSTKN